MTIRRYLLDDVEPIARQQALLNQVHLSIDPDFYAPSKSAEETFADYARQRFTDNDFTILVAEEESRMVGYVMGWIQVRPPIYHLRRVGYLSNIFVDRQERRTGVGKELYDSLERWFVSRNVDFVEIQADARNPSAVASFKKYGFNELSLTFYKRVKGGKVYPGGTKIQP